MSSKKRFQTAKDENTLPIVNNRNIYRAGHAPHFNPNSNNNSNDNSDDDELIANSYIIADQLQSGQKPTFVDYIKGRKDAKGNVITKSSILGKRNTIKQRSLSPQPQTQPQHQSQQSQQSYTQNNNQSQNDNNDADDDNDDDDDDEEFDLDLDNLSVPKAETDPTDANQRDTLRERFREQLKLRQEQEQQAGPIVVKQDDNDNDSDSDDDESSSEYETDSDDDGDDDGDLDDDPQNNIQLLRKKMVFLTGSEREKLNNNCNKISLDEEADILDKLFEERQKEITLQTKEDIYNYIRIEDKKYNDNNSDDDVSDIDMPSDTDDDINGIEGQKAFELWKLREIKRNLRDKKIKQDRIKDLEILSNRRNMTDYEIIQDNNKLGIKQETERNKMKFMQKYYHQGVFYRDDGGIVDNKLLNRNFNAPTGKDKYINYDAVPNAMKKKNFGKMSQSKWTHLVNEDTTNLKDNYQFAHKQYSNNFWFKRGGNNDKYNRFEKHDYINNNKYKNTKKRKDYDDRDKDDKLPSNKHRRYK